MSERSLLKSILTILATRFRTHKISVLVVDVEVLDLTFGVITAENGKQAVSRAGGRT